MNKYKINKCPYCNKSASIVIPDGDNIYMYWVDCCWCFLSSPTFKKKIDAVRVWNSIKMESKK